MSVLDVPGATELYRRGYGKNVEGIKLGRSARMRRLATDVEFHHMSWMIATKSIPSRRAQQDEGGLWMRASKGTMRCVRALEGSEWQGSRNPIHPL